jgi:hypothetical protein
MTKDRRGYLLKLSAVLVAFFAGAHGLMAQASRTWVSGTGSDAAACTRTAPCLTFSNALAQTATGGEIDVLDAGDFGPVNINKAVSIVADHVFAGIHVVTGTAITINPPSGKVVLKGLTLEGQGATGTGIDFLGADALYVESCTISGFGTYGIFSDGAVGKVFIEDSLVRDNGYAPPSGVIGGGIILQSTRFGPFPVTAFVDGTRIENNGSFGLKAYDLSNVVVRNSVVRANGSNGIVANANLGIPSLLIENSESSYNGGNGVVVSNNMNTTAPLVVRISNMIITGNGATGLLALSNPGPASINSFVNNKNDGNIVNGSPNNTIPQQ